MGITKRGVAGGGSAQGWRRGKFLDCLQRDDQVFNGNDGKETEMTLLRGGDTDDIKIALRPQTRMKCLVRRTVASNWAASGVPQRVNMFFTSPCLQWHGEVVPGILGSTVGKPVREWANAVCGWYCGGIVV